MNCCDANGRCRCSSGSGSRGAGVAQIRYPSAGGCLARHETAGMGLTEKGHGPDQRCFAVEAYKPPLFGNRQQRRALFRVLRTVLVVLGVLVGAAVLLGLATGALS